MKDFFYSIDRARWDSRAARNVAAELVKRADELDSEDTILPMDVRVGATFWYGSCRRRIARPLNGEWLAFDDDMNMCARFSGALSDAAIYFVEDCGYTKEPRT